jgi:hypothetical protein
MKNFILGVLFLLLPGLVWAQLPTAVKPPLLPLKDVRAGLQGTAYTVFAGTEPEAFGVEILGVLDGTPEARQSLIIARLSGANATRTGVFAGMSGSPVYVGDKLLGAISYSFPFSKEPIAGITPIEQMLDNFTGDNGPRRAPNFNGPASFTQLVAAEWRPEGLGPAQADSLTLNAPSGSPLSPWAGQVFQPIATPLVCNGVTPETLALFAPQLASYNLRPVAGAGGSSALTPLAPFNEKTLTGGRSLSAQLARGDYSFDAAGTITLRDGEKIYAFGHPFLRLGAGEMALAENEVVTVIPNINNSFKMSSARRMVGSITQDRASGVYGQLGRAPRMIPVRVNLNNSRGGLETFNFELLEDPALTPVLLQITVFSSLASSERTFGAGGYTLNGQIQVAGQPAVKIERRLANNSPALSTANAAAGLVSALLTTGLQQVKLEGVTLNIFATQERNVAALERLALDKTEAGRGETVIIRAFARALTGQQFTQDIPLKIPSDAPLGELTLTVADGLATQQKSAAQSFAPRDISQLVNALNNLRKSDRLYVKLSRTAAGAVIAASELPNLPPSMLATLGHERNAGGYTATVSSPIYETEVAPAAFIIAGQQSVTLKIVR